MQNNATQKHLHQGSKMPQTIALKQSSLAQQAMCLDALVQDKRVLCQPSLSEVLEYKNQHIIDGLISALDIDAAIAEQLFTDGLMWLWYCNNHASEGYREINDPILILDEVWHTFLLYTPYYTQFCLSYFGTYLHHMPSLNQSEEANAESSREQYLKRQKKQLETVYDLLGKAVFIRWYHEYPKIYTRDCIRAMRKK